MTSLAAPDGHALRPEIAAWLARTPPVPLTAMQGDAPVMAAVHDTRLAVRHGSIAARIYRPHGAQSGGPLAVLLHGGGWCRGDVQLYDTPCRALAQACGAVLVFIDYRLAPATPFPGALEDATDALAALSSRAHEWDCDPSRIVLVGDSAGGNLAAVCCQQLRGTAGLAIAHQVLIYPALDATLQRPSYLRLAHAPLITVDGLRRDLRAYLGAGGRADDVRVSPLLARDLAGLPPTCIVTCALDPLCDDGLHYLARLRAAGVATRHLHLEGVPHMAIHLRGISETCAGIYDWIARALGGWPAA